MSRPRAASSARTAIHPHQHQERPGSAALAGGHYNVALRSPWAQCHEGCGLCRYPAGSHSR
eukprot:326131-Pyramimonas_sp.AAC.1